MTPERTIRRYFEGIIKNETQDEETSKTWLTRKGKTEYHYPVIEARWRDFLQGFRQGEELHEYQNQDIQ